MFDFWCYIPWRFEKVLGARAPTQHEENVSPLSAISQLKMRSLGLLLAGWVWWVVAQIEAELSRERRIDEAEMPCLFGLSKKKIRRREI